MLIIILMNVISFLIAIIVYIYILSNDSFFLVPSINLSF